MKKIITTNFIIAVFAIALVWWNFLSFDELRYDSWRSDNISGYQFQEAPDYFKHLEDRKIKRFILIESLIVVSALLLMKGVKRDDPKI